MKQESRPWARHYQDEWQRRAGDRRLPDWLRVAALAFGSHQNNGHAPFKRGEIALILGKVDADGVVRPHANVGRAIGDAVRYGWLADGSYWKCLIVPAHGIRKGDLYAPVSTCPLAPRHEAKRSLSEPNDLRSSTPDERFGKQTAHSVSASPRRSLSSVLSTPATDQPTPRRTA